MTTAEILVSVPGGSSALRWWVEWDGSTAWLMDDSGFIEPEPSTTLWGLLSDLGLFTGGCSAVAVAGGDGVECWAE